MPPHERPSSLQANLEAVASALEPIKDESELSSREIHGAVHLYHELERILSKRTRTGDLMALPSNIQVENPFKSTFQSLLKEFDAADSAVRQATELHAAAVRPLSRENLTEQLDDFFILDNSLRETTVGASLGHTMQEKHKIIECIADTGLEEVILGAYGSKISVCSQIPEHWRSLGRSFDKTWGFSESFDLLPFDDSVIWDQVPEFMEKRKRGSVLPEYYTPPAEVATTYSKHDRDLFKKAAKSFRPNAFKEKTIGQVLDKCESPEGRVPMGLLMMAGYGICNTILDVDTSLETFDYDSFDLVKRFTFLLKWTKQHLPHRQDAGEDKTARVLINLRDFANYKRSEGGLEQALYMVDALCRLPPDLRPFGFLMEDPTGYLFPEEVGWMVRMIRLTMDRAGYPEGKFLVHLHMNFSLAEAVTLTALCNGANGVWAAVCKAGAQVGHACSTVTAVNLFRAGHLNVAKKYDLHRMCEAARQVTEICTRKSCPDEEEVYGRHAFDVPFMMTSVPSCRYAIGTLMEELKVSRCMRLNEICLPSSVHQAMIEHFGEPAVAGWDPACCPKMWDAIHNHLLTGLSRDYNTSLGLGHLYHLVSKENIPSGMIKNMLENSNVPDDHPTILEYVQRWNRLCAKYEGIDLPVPGCASKSIMEYNLDITVRPRRKMLPFDFFFEDVMRNPALEPVPKMFKSQVVKLVVQEERELQGCGEPKVYFYESILRLKLFIEEAKSLGVMGLVDDFVVRKNHDFWFGEDNLWLAQVRGSRPKAIKGLLRRHMDYFPRFYVTQGNNAIMRCMRAAAQRLSGNLSIQDDLQSMRRGSAVVAVNAVANTRRSTLRLGASERRLNASAKAAFHAAHEGSDADGIQIDCDQIGPCGIGMSSIEEVVAAAAKEGDIAEKTLVEQYEEQTESEEAIQNVEERGKKRNRRKRKWFAPFMRMPFKRKKDPSSLQASSNSPTSAQTAAPKKPLVAL